MGIALTTFTAFSTPLRTLARWLHHTSHLKEPTTADSPPPHSVSDDTARGHSGSAAGTNKPHHRPSGIPGQRPLRGNWPFTVSPQTPPKGAQNRLAATNTDGRAFMSSPAAIRSTCGSSRSAEGSGSRAKTAKVLCGVPASGGTDRLVITGRMADVCAELDRMAASEAALQAY